VFGEDPTVNRLQKTVAKLLGKEAALFTPSGVMANQLGIKIQTNPGDEVIVEQESHIFNYETAAPSVLSQVQLHPVKGTHGILNIEHLESALRTQAYYLPRTALICLENTHNRAGGTIYPIETIKAVSRFARQHGVATHLDGARLWNASVTSGISPLQYARYFDTVSVCFSKGLGAPIGSAIAGPKGLMDVARKFRKIFGGGMRQVGIIAAGALYALEHNIPRLKEDHEKARWFAEEVAGSTRLQVNVETVQTNIVILDVTQTKQTPLEVLARLRKKRVLLTEAGPTTVRAVMHMDVSQAQVNEAAIIMKSLFG
jgi:threonine aldolase